ncbi:MAG TPA: hypothetical protein VHF06_26330 [Pseudonocardiaceae bacterium]|nr:hypothetical protein [Pseudonocardiaceae bacterium]
MTVTLVRVPLLALTTMGVAGLTAAPEADGVIVIATSATAGDPPSAPALAPLPPEPDVLVGVPVDVDEQPASITAAAANPITPIVNRRCLRPVPLPSYICPS